MDTPHYKIFVKKYLLWTCSICLIIDVAFIAVFYTIDPLQFFHRSKALNSPLFSNMRVQAAGILNTFSIDSIILGTSMLENTSAAEASAKIGGKFFNISIEGGDYTERAIILKRALQKNIKNIIFSLDIYYRYCPNNDIRIQTYLYDDNHINDIKYYATIKNIRKIFLDNYGLTKMDHDRPNAWFNVPDHRDRFGGIEQWVAHKENSQVNGFLFRELPAAAQKFKTDIRQELHAYDKERMAKQYIEKNILEIIKCHPGTNFYFIFPPYSRFMYATMRRSAPQDFFLHQEIIRYLVDRTKNDKNIHIYGFEDQDFPDDIANYKDPTHYHQKFNSMFLDAIAAGRHELTPEMVEGYLQRCEQKAWDFDIPALNAKVQRLLEASPARGETTLKDG